MLSNTAAITAADRAHGDLAIWSRLLRFRELFLRISHHPISPLTDILSREFGAQDDRLVRMLSIFFRYERIALTGRGIPSIIERQE
jgi:hypothetical protein